MATLSSRFILWVVALQCSTYGALHCPTYGMFECAGRGDCESDGTCTCKDGFAGPDCAVVLACDPRATRLPCSGRGRCTLQNGCECAPGYSGALCESDDWCPRDALGRKCGAAGICADHTCHCPSHRSGVACEQNHPGAREVPVVEERVS